MTSSITKKKIKTPYHSLIYGVAMHKDKVDIKPIHPFRKFISPMYGNDNGGNEVYIGFEYDRIYDLYKHMKPIYNGKLSFSQATPPQSIIDLFNETYPSKTGTIFALIQDVYTSHYVDGIIITGYPINKPIIENKDSDEDEDFDYMIDNATYITDEYGCRIFNVGAGHNMNTPFTFFYGKEIANLPTNEDSNEAHTLAKTLNTVYEFKSTDLPTREDCLKKIHKIDSRFSLNELPIMVMIQTMCYCCT